MTIGEMFQRNWLAIVIAVVAAGAAWGENRWQIQDLMKTQAQQVKIQERQTKLFEQQARDDERIKAIQKSTERTEQMIQQYLMTQ